MNNNHDKTLLHLPELDGVNYVVDDNLGLWIKFVVKRINITDERPHGIRYSLSLHNRLNQRMLGFDNAHSIASITKNKIITYDHYHTENPGRMKIYHYENAATLLQDFWAAVDKKIKEVSHDS